MVEELSHAVFDPMSSDATIRERSFDWLDRIEDDDADTEEVRDELRKELRLELLFGEYIESPGFTPEHMAPLTAGSLVQHAETRFGHRIDRAKDQLDCTTDNNARRLGEEAAAAVYADANSAIARRIRSSLDEREDEQTA